MDWITTRVKEPSTWAGVAILCVGIGVLMGMAWLAIGGMVGGVVAMIMKEQAK
jgi:uncharacterized membrane protein YkgB